MKRLLCILSNMNAGGAETFLMKVYRALDRSKYQMDFCLNVQEKCFYNDEILALGGRIFYIPSKSQNASIFKKKLSALVRDREYKYVLRITSNAAGFMDLMIAKKAGAKICSARSSNSSDGGSKIVNMIHRVARAMYVKYVDVKFAPSDLAAIYTFGERAYKRGEVTVLPNAVDLNVFKYDEVARDQIRLQFNISESTTVIGHIGRFMEQKNHSFLVKIFDSIHKTNPDTVLLLVGVGGLEAQIKEQIASYGLAENVIFAGLRSDVPQVLSAMDVFVMPSFFEGMPNTVIEAQATGLPCLISDTITREANITGLVEYLPLQNPDVWATKALSLVSENRLDTKQAFRENKYDIESTVGTFVNLVFGERYI